MKHKRLVGGGVMKIVNNTVPQALMRLDYSPEEVAQIVDYIDRNGSLEGAPGLSPSICRYSIARCIHSAAFHRLARTPEDDGCGAAVPFRRDQQDHQHA